MVSLKYNGNVLLYINLLKMIELYRKGFVDGKIFVQDKLKISWESVDKIKSMVSICLVLCFM